MKSLLGVEKLGIAVVFIFYVIAGIVQLVIVAISAVPPVGVLAVLCLIAAYGLIKMRRWAVWLVMMLLFPEITLAAMPLYASITQQQALFPNLEWSLLQLTLVIYAIAILVASIYVLVKRQDFH